MKGLLIILIFFIIFEIPISLGMGLIFKKMKLDFKKGIIPFYNKIILIKYYRLPQYHLILTFVPLIGLYTNYIINEKMCKQYNKNIVYALQLTFMPFIYNIFLGLELKETKEDESIDNYFEDQKNLYQKTEKKETEPIEKDEYVWKPKKINKSTTVYKASRNNLSARVNINKKTNDQIIDNKVNDKQKRKNNNEEAKNCPKCGAKMALDAEICFLCGTKLK